MTAPLLSDQGDAGRWDALVDNAMREINTRWGRYPVGAMSSPLMDQAIVRATAEAILLPLDAEVTLLRAALRPAPCTRCAELQQRILGAVAILTTAGASHYERVSAGALLLTAGLDVKP